MRVVFPAEATLVLAVVVAVVVAVFMCVVALGGGQDPATCPTKVYWERGRGSTSNTWEIVKGPYEEVHLKDCGDHVARIYVFPK